MLSSWCRALRSRLQPLSRRPAAARPRRTVPPRLEALEDRLTPSLSTVYNTTAFPFRAVVDLQVTFPDHQQFHGSGALIDRFHVLTAGHMLYSYQDGGLASSVVVTPARSGNYAPYGTATMVWERVYSRWEQASRDHPGTSEPGDYDIGLITLNKAIGDLTGWFGMYYQTTNDPGQLGNLYSGLSLNTAGYPGSNLEPARLLNGTTAYGTTMYHDFGRVSGVNDHPWYDFWSDRSSDGLLLEYSQSTIETHPGQSGSPVWYYDGQSLNSIGIDGVDVAGDGSTGYATRITQQMYNDFHGAMNYDAAYRPPQPAYAASGTPPAGNYVNAQYRVALNSNWGHTINSAPTLITQTPPPPVGSAPPPAPTPTPPPTQVVTPPLPSRQTVGVFDPATATWYLRGSNTAGAPDAGRFTYGAPGWVSVVGDWSGSGHAGIGVFDPATATWYLRNEASAGAPDAGRFAFGAPGWIPVVGDWTASRRTGVGVFNPAGAAFYLRNESSAGAPDAGQFAFGAPGWIPLTGDFKPPASGIAEAARAASPAADALPPDDLLARDAAFGSVFDSGL
jgi:V8-like Glu-specific endopeptidase